MIVKLLTERHLEFLSLKGGCTGSSESTLVKMSNCWKSRALALKYLLSLPCLIGRSWWFTAVHVVLNPGLSVQRESQPTLKFVYKGFKITV